MLLIIDGIINQKDHSRTSKFSNSNNMLSYADVVLSRKLKNKYFEVVKNRYGTGDQNNINEDHILSFLALLLDWKTHNSFIQNIFHLCESNLDKFSVTDLQELKDYITKLQFKKV